MNLKPQSVDMASNANLCINISQILAANITLSSAAPSTVQGGNVGGRSSYAQAARKPVVGSKVSDHSIIKASSKPREFHLHVANLNVNTTSDMISDNVKEHYVPVRCKTVKLFTIKDLLNYAVFLRTYYVCFCEN